MLTIDTTILVNWIVSGFVGLIFGIISAWITYRYERKRDDAAWEREKEKLQQQFNHDIYLLEMQHQQRIKEFETQLIEQKRESINKELLKGIDNPGREIEKLSTLTNLLIYGGVAHAGRSAPSAKLVKSQIFAEAFESIDDFKIFSAGTFTDRQIQAKIAWSTVGWIEIYGDIMNAALPINIIAGDYVLFSFVTEIKYLKNDDICLFFHTNNGEYPNGILLGRYKEFQKLIITESTFPEYELTVPLNDIQLIGIVFCIAKVAKKQF